MSLPEDDAATLSARWTEGVLLKRDVFSTIERGRFRSDAGEVDAVLRRLDQVPWWSYIPARHLFARERRALALARGLHVGPELLWAGRQALVRGFINGVALHLAKPAGDVAYFRSAKQALRKLQRAGICHNDLAKEQNWLRGIDGRAYLTDFQLAACFRTRGRLFRIAAYEDLRHLLKHKRSYAPEALTPKERKILARKSLVASIWLKTGKKVYRTEIMVNELVLLSGRGDGESGGGYGGGARQSGGAHGGSGGYDQRPAAPVHDDYGDTGITDDDIPF